MSPVSPPRSLACGPFRSSSMTLRLLRISGRDSSYIPFCLDLHSVFPIPAFRHSRPSPRLRLLLPRVPRHVPTLRCSPSRIRMPYSNRSEIAQYLPCQTTIPGSKWRCARTVSRRSGKSCALLGSVRRKSSDPKTLEQEAVAQRPSLWLLRQTSEDRRRCSRPQGLGVWHSWKAEHNLGGRTLQTHRDLSRRYAPPFSHKAIHEVG